MRPLLLLLLALLPPSSFEARTQALYAARDVDGLRALCARPATTEQDLLCRYRLFPLTENERYLRELPTELPHGSARAQALLSGLWGYRTMRAPFYQLPTLGRRSARLMDAARAADPDDPFVLLVRGQSYLFRPAIAGGDARVALTSFRQLRAVAARDTGCGVSPLEADLWTWYALARLHDPEAPALRARLLAEEPPRLYREFLDQTP